MPQLPQHISSAGAGSVRQTYIQRVGCKHHWSSSRQVPPTHYQQQVGWWNWLIIIMPVLSSCSFSCSLHPSVSSPSLGKIENEDQDQILSHPRTRKSPHASSSLNLFQQELSGIFRCSWYHHQQWGIREHLLQKKNFFRALTLFSKTVVQVARIGGRGWG